MNYEQKNALIANILGCLGFVVMVFGGLFYLLDREPWQAVVSAAGILLMGLGAFADN